MLEQGRRLAADFVQYSFRPGRWMLRRFSRLDDSRRPLLWVIGLFLVLAIPASIIRASNLEEGRIIAMARGVQHAKEQRSAIQTS